MHVRVYGTLVATGALRWTGLAGAALTLAGLALTYVITTNSAPEHETRPTTH